MPWDVSSGALPVGPRPKVMVHFSLPADEVVPQPDGGLLTAGDQVEDYTPSIRPDSDNEQGGEEGQAVAPEEFLEVHCRPQLLLERQLASGNLKERLKDVNLRF